MLVDEYDKPILDALGTPELARANRDYLRGFYGVIKDSARHVRFVLVTGISMFSRVSLLSGLNTLRVSIHSGEYFGAWEAGPREGQRQGKARIGEGAARRCRVASLAAFRLQPEKVGE